MMLIDIISNLGDSLGWAKCFKEELTHFGEYSSKNIAYRRLLSEKVVCPQYNLLSACHILEVLVGQTFVPSATQF